MNLNKFFFIILFFLFAHACADYNVNKTKIDIEKNYFSSKGFALVYEDQLYLNKTLNKKLNNNEVMVMHNFLKKNTPVKIINPINDKSVDEKTGSFMFYLVRDKIRATRITNTLLH